MRTKPPFKPTEEEHKLVEQMIAVGIPQASVARMIRGGIDEKTLRKHFRDELDTGAIKADARVSGMLYTNCLAGKETSIIWWEKTRQGRKEKTEVAHSGDVLTAILESLTPTKGTLPSGKP